ncbi:hypothetical protein D9611_014827 [Ephemerocybe angulata]|uniref:Uncharacterized protein n=1 Tax=Ephemerocybe angulata TaxID=980116 RepID=A0A8H5FIT2_9AGAR|nr:hypothetical protein D9611_014827 [Tulosesus angulatus]
MVHGISNCFPETAAQCKPAVYKVVVDLNGEQPVVYLQLTMSDSMPSPSLQPDVGGFAEESHTVLRTCHPKLWQLYTSAREVFWNPANIVLDTDVQHWNTIVTLSEKRAVSRILSFLATADGFVVDTIVGRLFQEVAIMEAKYFYGFQLAMENIHAEAYAKLIARLIPDYNDQQSLVHWSTGLPSIAFKNIWAIKWILEDNRTFAERLVAFVCVEGIFFSPSFAVISKISGSDKMPGLSEINRKVSIDEQFHISFSCAMLRTLEERLPEDTVKDIVREAVDIEIEYVRDLMNVPSPLISIVDLQEYVHFCADQVLSDMGYGVMYGASLPSGLSYP